MRHTEARPQAETFRWSCSPRPAVRLTCQWFLQLRGQDAFFHYLPVSEETMNSGMYVTGLGRATIHAGDRYPPSGHPILYQFDWARGRTLPEFQLVLLTDGAGEFESEATGNVQFEGAALLFLFPGVWHRYRPELKVGWKERWISFNGELLHRLFDVAMLGPAWPFRCRMTLRDWPHAGTKCSRRPQQCRSSIQPCSLFKRWP